MARSNKRKKQRKKSSKRGNELRFEFDRKVSAECSGRHVSSDAGLLFMADLEHCIDLVKPTAEKFTDPRKWSEHAFDSMLKLSLFNRVSGNGCVSDADLVKDDPVFRRIVGGKVGGEDGVLPSSSQMDRFETEWLTREENLELLKLVPGQWVDKFFRSHKQSIDKVILDVDSTYSEAFGNKQEGVEYNGLFGGKGFHPIFLFNNFGMVEACKQRHGKAHTAEDWESFLEPRLQHYAKQENIQCWLRGDAGYNTPKLYEMLESLDFNYALRLRWNPVLQRECAKIKLPKITNRTPDKHTLYREFSYAAKSWNKSRRVVVKFERKKKDDELELFYTAVGVIVTNIPAEQMSAEKVCKFYNQRATAEQFIREGKQSFNWTSMPCKRLVENEVRLHLNVLAYNLTVFMRCLEGLPKAMRTWSLTSLQRHLIKIGARVTKHARQYRFHLAEVKVSHAMLKQILRAIKNLHGPPRPFASVLV